tara:strand:+ start:63 stop:671 length:609 start_codon:yes stop_codon:yes gene_type:complete
MTTSIFYFKGGLLLGFFGEWNKPAVIKKISAVKPKFLINKAEALKPVTHQFTFFETLNDKTMTKYVGLHGEMLPLSLSAKPVFLFEKKNTSSLVVEPLKSDLKSKTFKTIQKEKQTSLSTLHRFFVQVSSFRNQKKAEALKIKLQEKGFDSFLIEMKLSNHEGKWYRVFLGKYSDKDLASKDAELARKEFRLNAVVVRKTLG